MFPQVRVCNPCWPGKGLAAWHATDSGTWRKHNASAACHAGHRLGGIKNVPCKTVIKIRTTEEQVGYERILISRFNPLEFRGNYSATSNNMKLVHWPLMSELLHLVQRRGAWAGPQPAQARSDVTEPGIANKPTVLIRWINLCWINDVIRNWTGHVTRESVPPVQQPPLRMAYN